MLHGVKRPGSGVDNYPFLEPRLKKEYSYTYTPFCAFMVCSRVNFTFILVLMKIQLKVL